MKKPRLKVAVVTGSRAEFGLLEPVIRAIRKHPRLTLFMVAGGAHLLPPARTIREVEAKIKVAARVPMQRPGKTGRAADAAALGRGMEGFARAFARLKPDWVVVLGDRIEAFAAASAASVAGIAVCHIHGGDRAEGIADEAMRHAITKLSHMHCAATELSARRIVRMGESDRHVHVTGSPAIDGLAKIKPMSSQAAAALGNPRAVILLHPTGLSPKQEMSWTHKALQTAKAIVDPLWKNAASKHFQNVLILGPNSDAGHETISESWNYAVRLGGAALVGHLTRDHFLALLRRLARVGGALVGNSSAGLIEAAALRVPVVNLGPRQAGRERALNVFDVAKIVRGASATEERAIRNLIDRGVPAGHPFGDGRAGPRIAALLARTDPHDPALLRKRNRY